MCFWNESNKWLQTDIWNNTKRCLYLKEYIVVICRLYSWCISLRNCLWLNQCSYISLFWGRHIVLSCQSVTKMCIHTPHTFKLEYFKTLHACFLTYKIFHIVTAVWSDHFLRSCCPFCLEIFFIKTCVCKNPTF